MSDAADGAVMLAHATAHAALLYGGQAEDYADIMWQAITDDHLDQIAIGTLIGHRYSLSLSSALAADRAGRDYAITRARMLIAQAEANDMALAADPGRRARWIGAATEILRELTRDA